MAAAALQGPQPAGQAFRAEDRGRRRHGSIAGSSGNRRKLPYHVRSRKDTPGNSHLPRRQTPQSVAIGLRRRAYRLPDHPGPVSQQTGCRLFHTDPSVPQARREKSLQKRHAKAGILEGRLRKAI